MVFLTGDLGFMALEPLRDAMGPRFINCGVAEQNMVSVAAALSYEGLEAWTYTIAPFCYARAFEQIRNDVCLHGLAVKLLANGGGYAYGVMGPTHHALEDYGILLTLPNMTAFVPAFTEDITDTLERSGRLVRPSLYSSWAGRKARRRGCAPLRSLASPPRWRRRRDDRGWSSGGLRLGVLRQVDPASRPALWVVSELPIEANPPPLELTDALRRTRRLAVVEEHVAYGGVGQAMCRWVIEAGIGLDRFRHLHASACAGSTYGSQAFLRRGSGLDPEGFALAAKTLAS